MEIIRFDSATPIASKKSSANRIYLEETTFCCPTCEKQSSVKFTNVIFRMMEFYCEGCGNAYKVTNPAFAPTK